MPYNLDGFGTTIPFVLGWVVIGCFVFRVLAPPAAKWSILAFEEVVIGLRMASFRFAARSEKPRENVSPR